MIEQFRQALPLKVDEKATPDFEEWARKRLRDITQVDKSSMFVAVNLYTGRHMRRFYRKPDAIIPSGEDGWQIEWAEYEISQLAVLNPNLTGEAVKLGSSPFMESTQLDIGTDDSFVLAYPGISDDSTFGMGLNLHKYSESCLSSSLNWNTFITASIPTSRYSNDFYFDYEGRLIDIIIGTYGGFIHKSPECMPPEHDLRIRLSKQGVGILQVGDGVIGEFAPNKPFEFYGKDQKVIVDANEKQFQIVVYMKDNPLDIDYELTVPLGLPMETVFDHNSIPRRRVAYEDLIIPDELRRHPDQPLSDLDANWRDANLPEFLGIEIRKHNRGPRVVPA